MRRAASSGAGGRRFWQGGLVSYAVLAFPKHGPEILLAGFGSRGDSAGRFCPDESLKLALQPFRQHGGAPVQLAVARPEKAIMAPIGMRSEGRGQSLSIDAITRQNERTHRDPKPGGRRLHR
jgi:hypothetical protein